MMEIDKGLTMKRILGIEGKKRIKTCVLIEKEIYEVIQANSMRLSDLVNLALEKHLREKGLL